MNIEQEISDWIEGSKYWLLYATNQLLDQRKCDQDFIEEIYQLFLEDNDLKEIDSPRQKIEQAKKSTDSTSTQIVGISKIKNIKNVNALEAEQEILLSKRLTIIFGENGTGKSGYTRLLNNAFNSRGDTEILSDINKSDEQKEPECQFDILTETGIDEVTYPTQSDHQVFHKYSVFDSKAGTIQLTQENNLIFTPNGFDYFEKLMKLFLGLKELLNNDIALSNKPNEFISNFRFENKIQILISNLSANTKEEELKAYETFAQKDQEKIEILIHKKQTLAKENVPKKIEELSKRKTEIIKLGEYINSYLSKLSKDDIELYNSLIELKLDLEKREKTEGIKSFEDYKIPNIGSNEWKSFLERSSEYISTFTNSKTELVQCPLCLQSLNEKEIELFEAYWNLLKSEVQKEINRVKEKIEKSVSALKALPNLKFDSSTSLYNYLKEEHSDIVDTTEAIIQYCNNNSVNILSKFSQAESKIELEYQTFDLKYLNEPVKRINELGKTLIEKDPTKEIAQIQNAINELNDTKLLSQLLPSITKWQAQLKWSEKAKKAINSLKTNAITKKQGELFQVAITEKYKSEFEKECKAIRAPKVVEINQRNSKGTTLRRLQIKGTAANKILSEGEQKSISIADFFTENGLDTDNIGLIFDDPITSLDHKRRKLITKRIIEASKTKQVVIFTHSITFLMELEKYAGEENVECEITTMRRFKDAVGVIRPELPWVAQKVSKRVKYLRGALVRIRKIETESPDLYEQAIKGWYVFLREGWERAVEERLLKGVVTRFGFGVSTKPLRRISITDDLLDRVEKGMTEGSDWAHDSASGLNPTLPTIEDAEIALSEFDEFCKICGT